MGKTDHFFSILLGIIFASAFICPDIHAGKPLSMYFSAEYDSITGLTGVKFGDEICIMPQYEDVSFDYVTTNQDGGYWIDKQNVFKYPETKAGLFGYKENGKWGVSSIYYKLTKPIFDHVRFVSDNNWLVIVQNDDKWGLCGLEGAEIMPCEYDSISNPIDISSCTYDNHPIVDNNLYFVVQKDGTKKLVDLFGTVIVDNYDDSCLSSNSHKEIASEFKRILKLEKKREKDKELVKKYTTGRFRAIDNYVAKLEPEKTALMLHQDLNGIYYLIKDDSMLRLPEEYEYELTYRSDADNTFFFFCKDGKWGLMSISGKIVIEPKYDKLSQINGWYYRAESNGKAGAVNILGNEFVPCEYDNVSYTLADDYSGHQIFEGRKGDVSTFYDPLKCEILPGKSIKEAREAYKKKENWRNGTTFFEEYAAAYEIDKDYCTKKSSFDSDGNYISTVSPNGLDLYLIRHSSASESLKRNPASIVGLARKFLESPSWQNNENLMGLKALAEEMGYEDSDFTRYIEAQVKYLGIYLAEKDKKEAEAERNARWSAQIDRISGALLGVLNTAMDAYNAASANTSDDSFSSSSTSSQDRKSRLNGNSMSKRHNYISDKRTYANYDSMLAAYFAGNRSASVSEKENWQKTMKKLREKWEREGMSFPHSVNEDR